LNKFLEVIVVRLITKRSPIWVAGLFAAMVLLHGSLSTESWAAETENQLFIVTSFPEKLFTRFKDAFQERHPTIKVKILNKKTSASISYIQETAARPLDLFWASAPDAFEVLKESGHLARHPLSHSNIPKSVGRYPINDPDGYYNGFAISGYGIMWNVPVLAKLGLPAPAEWGDLKKPGYYRNVGISAPSRSGTTHLIVETILQSEGWAKGWATLLEIGGNLATVTARSYGVPDGVNSGRFAIGMVIDFFGLSSMATGNPVKFTYPTSTTMVPANIAIIKNARHPRAAAAFIDFLLSAEGQKILFEPAIRRLPVLPSVYDKAPDGYPNPFTDEPLVPGVEFSSDLSRQRYHLVNALFDKMITFRIKALNKLWKTIHRAEGALKENPDGALKNTLARARQLAAQIPVDAAAASDSAFTGTFKRVKRGFTPPARQAEIVEEWSRFAHRTQVNALALAESVLSALVRQSAGKSK
jgi:phosphoglycerate transport regulatory protein PgtC